MKTQAVIRRQFVAACASAVALCGVLGVSSQAMAQTKIPMRISTPAVPDDWHAKMWTVFKENLDKSSANQFDVQINLNASLFKQGTEPAAMARGNLELSSISAFDIAKLVPDFSIFTAGYVIRDPAHQQKVFNGPIGENLFKTVSEKMDVTILSTVYLGTRQVNLRDVRNVKSPADLKGIKLRMPGTKEWLFLGEALGATATPLAFGEVYLGLKTGTIDGQDNPLPTVRAAKFYEVTKQLVLTNHQKWNLILQDFAKQLLWLLRSTTMKTESKKKVKSLISSRKKACKSQRQTWRPSRSRFKTLTPNLITPSHGQLDCWTASIRRVN